MMQTSTSPRLETTTSMLDLPNNYEADLLVITDEATIALSGLAEWNDDFTRSGLTLEQYLSQRAQFVGDTLSDTTKKVSAVISIVPDILSGLADFSDQDRSTYRTARRNVNLGYFESAKYNIDDQASSKQAKAAMRAGLDDIVFKAARRNVNLGYFESAKYNIDDQASSKQAKAAMRAGLDDRSSQRQSNSSYQKRRQQGYSHQQRKHQDRPHSAQPKTEQQPTIDAYDELITTLSSRNGDRDSMLLTVQSFDRSEVLMVINTVKVLREKNPKITDREIAVRYARASNNAETTSPQRQRATQIIMALMSDKISGSLPF